MQKKIKHVCYDPDHSAALEVFNQVKEKFKSSTNASERILLLTLAPKSWGRKKIAQEFQTTEHQAQKAIDLVKESGILSSPNPKIGKKLPF